MINLIFGIIIIAILFFGFFLNDKTGVWFLGVLTLVGFACSLCYAIQLIIEGGREMLK